MTAERAASRGGRAWLAGMGALLGVTGPARRIPMPLAEAVSTAISGATSGATSGASEVELAELAEAARAAGERVAGGLGGSGLGVHLRSVGGDVRERGVRCRSCLETTWNICGLCDGCHDGCSFAR